MQVIKRDGRGAPLDIQKIHKVTEWACQGLEVSQSELETEAQLMLFDGIKTTQIHEALIKAAATLISVKQPAYTFVAARLLLQTVLKEVSGGCDYPKLADYLARGVGEKRLSPVLLERFDLDALDAAIRPERDLQFTYLGLQTVADRYLIREGERGGAKRAAVIEAPQHFFMRVAMGLAVEEAAPTNRAIEFYNVLSTFQFMSSTPTLFNSGTLHPQLSSCYLNTVADQISAEAGEHRYASIYGTIEECANLSKFAGGIGTDWTRVRAAGDVIKSTNGKSSGVVPYLKVFNDTAVAVNQGGKRNGAFAAYLEPWHPDLYDFVDLKKNSGDERRRAHDIFPALWIPDLFFKRVRAGAAWSFFSPKRFPELHELFGDAFEQRYEALELAGEATRTEPALQVWKRVITSLFETGHPWITMKDECNRRNPQAHAGVIHNSNLCTEITLNTSDEETAVCNLGSVNLSRIHSYGQMREVVRTAVRMLDNVVDINFYPSDRARTANMRHRPIGLGVMGYTEAMVQRAIDWESRAHYDWADRTFAAFSYFAIEASADLAHERGSYESFKGSTWSRGMVPIDTANVQALQLTTAAKTLGLDWDALRARVAAGMRNSNVMAIAPTATISNITGTTPCIEPIFERQYTKSNLSGSFLVVDPCLVYGRPELCKEAFEVAPEWLVAAAAVRQKWLDQAQSLNLFVKAGIKGSELSAIYLQAWELGLKTTYYLRSQSQTLTLPGDGVKGATAPEASVQGQSGQGSDEAEGGFCSITSPDCESCQ
jgi:ribonucleoside-diphosphate reductase alpha chain